MSRAMLTVVNVQLAKNRSFIQIIIISTKLSELSQNLLYADKTRK